MNKYLHIRTENALIELLKLEHYARTLPENEWTDRETASSKSALSSLKKAADLINETNAYAYLSNLVGVYPDIKRLVKRHKEGGEILFGRFTVDDYLHPDMSYGVVDRKLVDAARATVEFLDSKGIEYDLTLGTMPIVGGKATTRYYSLEQTAHVKGRAVDFASENIMQYESQIHDWIKDEAPGVSVTLYKHYMHIEPAAKGFLVSYPMHKHSSHTDCTRLTRKFAK